MAKPQYSSRSPSTCLLHKLRDQNRPLPECFLWCVVMNDCVRCTAYCGQSLLWVDFCFACLQHPLPPCGNQTGLQVQTLATTAQMSSTAKRGTGRVNCFLVSDTRFNRFKIASIIYHLSMFLLYFCCFPLISRCSRFQVLHMWAPLERAYPLHMWCPLASACNLFSRRGGDHVCQLGFPEAFPQVRRGSQVRFYLSGPAMRPALVNCIALFATATGKRN